MIVDRYGNYVFQKIFKICNQNQRQFCLMKLKKNFVELLKNKEGTHTFQSILDMLSQDEIQENFWHFSEQ